MSSEPYSKKSPQLHFVKEDCYREEPENFAAPWEHVKSAGFSMFLIIMGMILGIFLVS